MTPQQIVDYHLAELEIARNKNDPSHCMPDIGPEETIVVDIGCGVTVRSAPSPQG